MNNKTLYDLMQGDKSLITEANCVLARLWRLTLDELRVRAAVWDSLMIDYKKECEDHLGKKDANNLKGNLPKALAKEEITFKAFCRGITVFKFKRVEFVLYLEKNGVKKTLTMEIPPTYKGDAGRYLKALWIEITNEFPECIDNWSQHIKAYKEKFKAAHGTGADSIGSNLPRTLDEDELTWNTFFQGVLVHDFDKMELELNLHTKASTASYPSILLVLK
jgi:hypothetical protein